MSTRYIIVTGPGRTASSAVDVAHGEGATEAEAWAEARTAAQHAGVDLSDARVVEYDTETHELGRDGLPREKRA